MQEDYLIETHHLFKVLSNPTRLKILILLEDKELSVTEIVNQLQMQQSSVSHQLLKLKEHQLVSAHRCGKSIRYQLRDPHVLKLLDMALAHSQHVVKNEPHDYGTEENKDSCDR
ncbi:metalloregulator ArsR/SmtB family transcription factor [Fructobacillus sp. W13]|uniref:Metalloregulator ArsR/SmtB family transcription factor n=1 Tax=Fructobacillus apis TaxID=2935017 RepID=A0ABT0ZR35_9LACO|nr:metalloregulator ArsR/SmtB family transcription factor [Fructobacillus apis]MCO0832456.1 metalloregulator ArsR/SmtB family transcription factor [Fructobacillus apis]